MTGRQKAWLAAALLGGLALGGAAGAFFGARFGFRLVLNEALSKDARSVRAHVGTLRDFRAGKRAEALESLESHVDDLLVLFDPHEPYPIHKRTQDEIEAAVRDAAAYRRKHPRRSGRASAKMAGELLKRFE